MRYKQTVKLTSEAAAELAGNKGKGAGIDAQDEHQVTVRTREAAHDDGFKRGKRAF